MFTPSKLLFGTAGIPISTPQRNTANGIKRVRELGLECMELEFVHSVNISKEKAPEINQVAEQQNILLTCHGQYYINLNSKEPQKIKASIHRILNAARIAKACGSWSVCFHAAFYMGATPENTSKAVHTALKEITKTLKDEGTEIWIRPETAGKITQWGDIKEIAKISQEIDMVLPCIDFSHLHARTNGKYNTNQEIYDMLAYLEKQLGKEAIKNMHIHMQGIEYNEKGERRHLPLKDSDINYKEILQAWKDFKLKGAVICESPIIEQDALVLKGFYDSLK